MDNGDVLQYVDTSGLQCIENDEEELMGKVFPIYILLFLILLLFEDDTQNF